MEGYKGFSPGMICKGKQYAENTVFEEDEAVICEKGMHFCENPLDVLEYYPFVNDNGELNEFAEVEALDEVKTDDGKKFVTKKLKVGRKLGIKELVDAFVEFMLSRAKEEKKETGYRSVASVSGKSSFAIATGISGKAKGALGCYIACAEWVFDDAADEYILANLKTHKVDGRIIKPNTFYQLENGKFTEVKT